MTLPLPRRTAELIDRVPVRHRQPGLLLDKHLDPPQKAEAQKSILEKVCGASGDSELLQSLRTGRNVALSGAIAWVASSRGPLTLHLSRATALENAGIAIHPLYGFAYLPGSGLKGLARAWAERIWLEAQPPSGREAAARKIREIFGYAPRSDEGKAWIPPELARSKKAASGSVVFHDAWPTRWPKLFVDIAAVHHPDYYQADDKQVPAPGDWEEPNPVCFLAIMPGTEFEFAVAPWRSEHHASAQQAREWLAAALAEWGAGAKTAAGYGRIVAREPLKPARSPQRARFECTLDLVTPAFLAGTEQGKADCDLRGATLRGQLRWWWRTMHSGHLEPRLLRRLEAAIWGASSEGSPIQLILGPGTGQSELFDRSAVISREHCSQSISYITYGMDERKEGRRLQRWYRREGSRWDVRIEARESHFNGVSLPSELVLRQAAAAFSLLSRYGGVGAKQRKGFGSLADVFVGEIRGSSDCARVANELREICGLRPGMGGNPTAASLDGMQEAQVVFPERSAWTALGRLAQTFQAFAQENTGRRKAVLGLPRKGIEIRNIPRHPSVALFHFAKNPSDFILRVCTFRAPHLDLDGHSGAELLDRLRDRLEGLSAGAPLVARGRRERPVQGPPRRGDKVFYEEELAIIRDIAEGQARIEFDGGDIEWVPLNKLKRT